MRDAEDNYEKKQWSFIDDVTVSDLILYIYLNIKMRRLKLIFSKQQFVAYKSRKENDCYLENIKQSPNVSRKKRQSKVLYASTVLTKLEVIII